MSVKFHLRSIDKAQVEAWKQAFGRNPAFEISHGDWFDPKFEKTLKTFDAVVSPANSFGFMGGGLDLPLRKYFGTDVENAVKEKIKGDFDGELIVGESTFVFTGHPDVPRLIVTPTVRTPRTEAGDTVNAYLAFKGLLRFLKAHPEIQNVLVPGLCTGVAGMPPFRSAVQMLFAWNAAHGIKMPQNDIIDVLKIFDSTGEANIIYNDRFMRTIKINMDLRT
jgi:O-acetyl-ADP-ribose deacetylase (regulator of RNase III)